MFQIREDVRRRVCDLFGEAGRSWLADLPILIRELSAEWRVELEDVCWGNYSVVVPGLDEEGRECILKLAPPESILQREIYALQVFDGEGSVHILREAGDRAAFLMERLRPGTDLTRLCEQGRDVEATEITCEVMRRLPKSQSRTTGILPTSADRAAELSGLRLIFGGGTGPFPSDLVQRAEGLFADLVGSQGEQVVIHGDLHHENILSSNRGWLAIDPHGLVAEPCFETYSLLLNPDGIPAHPDVAAITRRRIDQMSDLLGFDRDRIRGWGIACAVLSAWWSLEGHGSGYEDALTMAEIISSC